MPALDHDNWTTVPYLLAKLFLSSDTAIIAGRGICQGWRLLGAFSITRGRGGLRLIYSNLPKVYNLLH